MAPDKDLAEHSLRAPVVSRKNTLGSGSEWSAELAAAAWTVLGTAAMAGWEQDRYLRGTWRPAPGPAAGLRST